MNTAAAVMNHTIYADNRDAILPHIKAECWEGVGYYVREDDGHDTFCETEDRAEELILEMIEDGRITTEEVL